MLIRSKRIGAYSGRVVLNGNGLLFVPKTTYLAVYLYEMTGLMVIILDDNVDHFFPMLIE